MDKDYVFGLKQCVEMFNYIEKDTGKETIRNMTSYAMGTLFTHKDKFISDSGFDGFFSSQLICDLTQLNKLKYGKRKANRENAEQEAMRLVVNIRIMLQDTFDALKMEA